MTIINLSNVITAHLSINRNLNLRLRSDLDYLLGEIRKNPVLTPDESVISDSIEFISSNLKEEWLLIYPPIEREPLVSLRVGRRNSTSLGFLSEVIPLGIYLKYLQTLPKFDRILQKLSTDSHEKISALLEVFLAAKYYLNGYRIELEPPNSRGGLSDLKVEYNKNNWIYFECKAENMTDSEFYKRRTRFMQELLEEADEKIKDILPNYCRVDIELANDYRRRNEQSGLVDRIHNAVANGSYNSWINFRRARFIILKKGSPRNQLTMSMYLGIARLPKGTSILFDQIHLNVTYSSGNRTKRIRELIKKARDQLPIKDQGIIALRIFHPRLISQFTQNIFARSKYDNIIGILAIGPNERILEQNTKHYTTYDKFLDVLKN